MKIVRLYILREHGGPFIAALGVLTGLMLLNQLARRFSDLVGKGLPWYLIAEVFGLSTPFILAMTVPMAVLVAVLYSFSRLSSDNEITAFKAGGVSLLRLMAPLLIVASGLGVSMVWFNDSILPESNHHLRILLTDIGRKQPTFELRERVVNELVAGKLFLQAGRIDRTRSVLRDLVIFDLGRTGTDRTTYADSGYMAFNPTQTDLYLTLFDGIMYEGDAKDPGNDQHTRYSKQVVRVSGVSNELERGRGLEWRGDREMNIAMMREQVRERQGRLAGLADSLRQSLSTLAPLAGDTAGEAGRERGTGRGPASEGAAETEPGVPRGDAAARQEGARVSADQLRRRWTTARSAEWGYFRDPLMFVSRVRADLQRAAQRADINRREANKYSVEIHKKFAIPAAAIVFVLIGAPIGVRFPRGGIGMVIGVSLTVFCVYYVGLIGGENLADRDIISPFWAMWAPNVVFLAVGCAALHLVTRAGTRGPLFNRRPARVAGPGAGDGVERVR
jgi:lipopolysaccharide export system permease protein